MYEAWDAGAKRERIALAERALEISDLCADAHVLLAEEAAKTLAEARRHYEAGVAAGERALGPIYVLQNRENWSATPGPLRWLAETVQTLPPPDKNRR